MVEVYYRKDSLDLLQYSFTTLLAEAYTEDQSRHHKSKINVIVYYSANKYRNIIQKQ